VFVVWIARYRGSLWLGVLLALLGTFCARAQAASSSGYSTGQPLVAEHFSDSAHKRPIVAHYNGASCPACDPTDVGVSFGITIIITGITPVLPYSACNLNSGTLPPGLSIFLSNGVCNFSGIPTTPGSYTFVPYIADSANPPNVADTTTWTITINPAMTITTASLPSGLINSPYAGIQIGLTGGTAPYSWNVSGLPSGMSSNGSGLISGTPTQSGIFTVGVSVGDGAGGFVTTNPDLTLRVSGGPLGYTCSTLTGPVTVGVAYSNACTGFGGVPPYGWAINSGALPAGLSGNVGGNDGFSISGAPTAYGPFSYSIEIGDSNFPQTNYVGAAYSGIITLGPLNFTCSATNGAPAAVGGAYSNTCTASGGVPPYAWSISSGALPAGLSLNPSGGTLVISGTATGAGPYSFTIKLTDNNSPQGSFTKTYSGIVGPGLTFSCTASTGASPTVGLAYSNTCNASGGVAAYSWSISSGALPAGLSLSPSGPTLGISGTPTAPGMYSYTIKLTDSNSPVGSVTESYSGTVYTPLNPITCTAPTGAPPTVGLAYSNTCTASGGAAPYTWSISSGALPAGLSLSPSGPTLGISGTPTAPGMYSYTIKLTDSNSPAGSVTESYSGTVYTPLNPITCTAPTGAPPTVGLAYSNTCMATGGATPYTWSISSGALPAGLSLNPSGLISGTATTAGQYTYTIKLTDSNSPAGSATKSYSGTIYTPLNPITCSAPTGASPTVGLAYSNTCTVTGGATPYTWSISSGALPAGLSLSPSGGTLGISGTPTAAGPYSYTIQLTDSNSPAGSVTKTYAGTIYPGLTITTTVLPSGTAGQPYSVTLTASGGTGTGYAWAISGQPNGLNIGASSGVITGTPAAGSQGSHTITATLTDSGGNNASAQLVLTIGLPPITIVPTSLAAATEGAPYTAVKFDAGGGTGTGYTWTVSGQPSGLGINARTGLFSGTPAFGTSASSPYSVKVGVADSAGNSNSVQIPLTVNPAPATGITLSTPSLSFSYIQGGATPAPQSFGVLGTGGQTAFTVAASTISNGGWLTASASGSTTPANVTVSLQNLASLGVGMYQGSVQVQPQSSVGAQSVSVTLDVKPSTPRLNLSSDDVRFLLSPGSPAANSELEVVNTGGGSPSYSANVSSTSTPWLTITCGSQGNVSAGNPALICLKVDPTGLQAGTYVATLAVSGAGEQLNATLTLQVNSSPSSIVLSATAMNFTVVEGSFTVFPASQSSAVLNGGSATMNWTAQVNSSTAAPWLALSSSSGSSEPFGANQPAVTFTPNPAGLKAGDYSAVVNVTVPDGSAANSPAAITILLKVLPAGSKIPPAASTSGLIFIVPEGGLVSPAQALNLINGTDGQVDFSCLLYTAPGGADKTIPGWVSGPPAAGTVPGSGAFPMMVQANPQGLAAGTYNSQLRLGYSNGTHENVDVVLLVTPTVSPSLKAPASDTVKAAMAASALPHDTSCSSFALNFVGETPKDGSTVNAGTGYKLQLSAGCIPNPPDALNPLLYFSDGTQQTPIFNGQSQVYETSWTPSTASVGTAVQIQAQANPHNEVGLPVPVQPILYSLNVASADPLAGAFVSKVANAASGSNINEVAGGSFISIYGSQIASIVSLATTLPLAKQLGDVQVTLAGNALPLYYTSATQVNAIVPFLGDQYLNKDQALIVYRGCSPTGTGCIPSSPVNLNLVAIQPGIFPYQPTTPVEPPEQGAIEDANASYQVADPSHPAKPGDTISIYCAGLGQVKGTLVVGAAAPVGATTLSEPTVYIDGIQANVTYSGLAPESVGLYQVNAVVPQGIHSGTIQVYLTMPDSTGHPVSSNMVTIN